jgi:hypothetical protein
MKKRKTRVTRETRKRENEGNEDTEGNEGKGRRKEGQQKRRNLELLKSPPHARSGCAPRLTVDIGGQERERGGGVRGLASSK